MEKIPNTNTYEKTMQQNRVMVMRVQQILKEHNVPFHPILVENTPNFSLKVYEYIQNKIKSDIPKAKEAGALIEKAKTEDDFTGNEDLLVEIGGFLGVKGNQIDEISYSEPNFKNVSINKVSGGLLLRTTTPQPSELDYRLLESSDNIIHWHTHPKPSAPTERDFNAMLKYHKLFSGYFGNEKRVYYVIYIPELERGFWYEIKDSD